MFEGEFECFGENKEKYKNFSVAVKKEIIKADKEGNEIVKTKFYKTNLLIVQDLWQVQILLLI